MSLSPIIAFDLATEALLEMDFTAGVEQNANEVVREAVWKHRVLFLDELERLEAPRSQARPA